MVEFYGKDFLFQLKLDHIRLELQVLDVLLLTSKKKGIYQELIHIQKLVVLVLPALSRRVELVEQIKLLFPLLLILLLLELGRVYPQRL